MSGITPQESYRTTLLTNSQRLCDQYLQLWSSELLSSRNLRTFRLFKNLIAYEPYLNLPPHLRVSLAKLRSSAHQLRIETGRYTLPTPTPLEERTCMLCGVLMHFLVDCHKFDGRAREDLFNRCFILNSAFYFLNSLDRFTFIMLSRDHILIRRLATFVQQSFISLT